MSYYGKEFKQCMFIYLNEGKVCQSSINNRGGMNHTLRTFYSYNPKAKILAILSDSITIDDINKLINNQG